ncbi:MAG: hypothetical protein HDQ87_10270 [Clostridia bacterium]|nr:hypothetical protein [Clostridia bacterium]
MNYFTTLMSHRPMRIILNLAILIFGIIFIANPRSALVGITITAGILVLIYGVYGCVQFSLGRSQTALGWFIVEIIIGILLLVFAYPASRWLLPLVVGIWVLWTGINGLRATRNGEAPADNRTIAIATAELVLGVLILVCMAFSGWVMGLMIGICMLLYGAAALYGDIASIFGKKQSS